MKYDLLVTWRFAVFGLFVLGISAWAQSGQRDPTFAPGVGFDSYVFAAGLQLDGKIVVVGAYESFDGSPRHSFARLNAGGSLDDGFLPPSVGGPYPKALIYAIAIDGFGRITVGGLAFPLLRVLSDGSRDTNFNSSAGAYWLGINENNDIFVGGETVTKLFPDGTRDYSFNIGHRYNSDRSIYVGVFKTNGNVVLGGEFYYVADELRAHIAEVDRFGGLITNEFVEGVDGFGIYTLCVQPDQKVVAGGIFEGSVVRYTADGQIDTSFAPPYIADADGWPGYIGALALQSDGRILIGGEFVSIGEVPATNIARLLPDGSLDPSFQVGSEMNGQVRAIVLQPDGRIIVGGAFTSFNGAPAGHIFRLLGDRPVLNMKKGSADEMILNWPAAYTNYVLQTSSNLLSANWVTSTSLPIVVNNLYVQTNSIISRNQFFRLAKAVGK